MRMLVRAVPYLALALAAGNLQAQVKKSPDWTWYIGPQIGIMSVVTNSPVATRSNLVSVGGNVLIVAKRTGLLLQVDQGLQGTLQSTYNDATGPITVNFKNVRRYEAVLLAFPVRGFVEPYIGGGFGIVEAIGPAPAVLGATPAIQRTNELDIRELGSYSYGTLLAGLQFKVKGVTAFGQVQVATAPDLKVGISAGSTGRLLQDNMYNFNAGIRVSLGSAREKISTSAY